MDQLAASVIDSSGRIIVAGVQTDQLDDGIVQHIAPSRYSPSGVLDTTFGTNGVTVVTFGTRFENFQSLAIDSNGNILVAGIHGNHSIKVSRYFGGTAPTAGTIDMSFGTAGTLAVGVVPADFQAAIRVAADGDKVVVAGTTSGLDLTADFYVMRYTSTGAADPSFILETSPDPRSGYRVRLLQPNTISLAVPVMPDHSIIVAGSSLDPATFNSELVLVRLDASGAPNAYAFQDVGGTGEINALVLQGSNVIAAGDAFGLTTVAVRFDSTSGAFDSTSETLASRRSIRSLPKAVLKASRSIATATSAW